MIIYSDNTRNTSINYQLVENVKYILDFEDETSTNIYAEISKSGLSEYINWQEGNRYASLCISNYIGNIYIYNNTYNVRSSKFLNSLSGEEQFNLILNEIKLFSNNIIFAFDSPSFSVREEKRDQLTTNDMLIFNYFKNIILNKHLRERFNSNINNIIKKTTFKYEFSFSKDEITKCNFLDRNTLNYFLFKNQDLMILGDGHEHLLGLPISQQFSGKNGERFFPRRGIKRNFELNHDTPENRFVKYFIHYIASFSYRISNQKGISQSVRNDAEEMLCFCRRILNIDFFKNIGKMNIIPTNSSALQNRRGYKEIFAHYRHCRVGIMNYIQKFEIMSMSIGLKKISDLYEYWVFIQISKAFLGDEVLGNQGLMGLQDVIPYKTCLHKGDCKVYYNLTESQITQTSYSISLRPDITVIAKHNGKTCKFIFDAKYKTLDKSNDLQEIKQVKSEDIHKMHAYKDAIQEVKCAFVVYPGSDFLFFEKRGGTRKSITEIENFDGVGAIPLTPGNKEQYLQLCSLISRILNG